MGRIAKRTILLVLGCTALLAPSAPVAADGGTPLPVLVFPRFAFQPLGAADVRIPLDQSIAATRAYLDEYETALIRFDDELTRLKFNPTDMNEGPIRSKDEVRRVQDCDRRAFVLDNALRATFYAALADSASEEDKAIIESCMNQMSVMQNSQRMQGSYATMRYRAPDDFGAWLASRARDKTLSAADRRVLVLLCGQGAVQRAESFRATQQFLQTQELKHAEEADKLGPAARHNMDYETRQRLRNEPDSTGQGTEPWKRMVAAQLAAFRAIQPKLSESDRARLQTYWIPRVLNIQGPPKGIPSPSRGYMESNVADFVRQLLQIPGLSDETRERVRAAGRTWMANDTAVIDRAFVKLCDAGETVDVESERTACAAAAAKEIAALPGLDWFGTKPWPKFEPLPQTAADEKEFGKTPQFSMFRGEREQDEDKQADRVGLPSCLTASQAEEFATALELAADERVILLTVFEDARERWNNDVRPLVRKAAPAERYPTGAMQVSQMEAWYADRLSQLERREEAWKAANAFEDSMFEAVKGALGTKCNVAALDALRASRRSRRLEADEKNFYERAHSVARPMDMAGALIDGTLTGTAQAAGLTAAQAHWPTWLSALDRGIGATQEFRVAELDLRRTEAEHRTGEGVDPAVRKRVDQLREAAADQRTALVAASDQVNAAIAEALPAESRDRWEYVIDSLRHPAVYQDLRPFWRAADQAVACLTPEQRTSIKPLVDKLAADVMARQRRVGKRIIDEHLDNERSQVARFYLDACIEFAYAELAALLPDQCRPQVPSHVKQMVDDVLRMGGRERPTL
jgi:hypothetical protein